MASFFSCVNVTPFFVLLFICIFHFGKVDFNVEALCWVQILLHKLAETAQIVASLPCSSMVGLKWLPLCTNLHRSLSALVKKKNL